jgi:hypothetical protein
MNMLMARAKNVGVLDEVLEATDNRQAPIRFLLMKFLPFLPRSQIILLPQRLQCLASCVRTSFVPCHSPFALFPAAADEDFEFPDYSSWKG